MSIFIYLQCTFLSLTGHCLKLEGKECLSAQACAWEHLMRCAWSHLTRCAWGLPPRSTTLYKSAARSQEAVGELEGSWPLTAHNKNTTSPRKLSLSLPISESWPQVNSSKKITLTIRYTKKPTLFLSWTFLTSSNSPLKFTVWLPQSTLTLSSSANYLNPNSKSTFFSHDAPLISFK